MLALVALLDIKLEQLDIRKTFLHGDLDDDISMKKPKGFVQHHKGRLVCKLNKSLYGLKQSPRQLHKKFDSFMVIQGYTRSEYDHCLYFKRLNDILIILVLYVDDMLILSKSKDEIRKLKVRWPGLLI